jgi:hypothetical protein
MHVNNYYILLFDELGEGNICQQPALLSFRHIELVINLLWVRNILENTTLQSVFFMSKLANLV